MADITKCYNAEECPLKDKCYRHLAEDDRLQSYANFYIENMECEYYWEVNDD